MRMPLPRRLLILGPLLAVGCSNPFAIADGAFSVRAEANAFRLVNSDPALAVGYAVIEQQTSFVILLTPCTSWTPRIEPRSDEVVLYEEVVGYEAGADSAVVYWCRVDGNDLVESGSFTVPFD